MKQKKLPQTDSIQELARFWDKHDLTEFEDQLEEVNEPIFERTTVKIPLEPEEFQALRQIARSKGVEDADLIREWVREKLQFSAS